MILQNFEGVVKEIYDTEFVAVLYDRTNKKNGEEVATIPKSSLVEEELKYLSLGAVFSWHIDDSGNSMFRFSREVWTEEDLLQMRREAEKFYCLLGE